MTADMAARQARLGLLVVPEEPGARLAPSSFPEAVPTVPATVGRPAFRRAEVVAASAALESRRALEGVGASGLFDGTSVLGGLKRQSDGQDGLFLGLSVPLPIADRRAGARSVALEASRIAEAELDAVRLRTASEAVVAETTLRALLPSAERALAQVRGAAGLLESALASYEEAETSLLELIDAARTELELATMEAELRRDAWMALYTWEWARGTEPGQEVEDR
jgi:outer membrane protein TolC